MQSGQLILFPFELPLGCFELFFQCFCFGFQIFTLLCVWVSRLRGARVPLYGAVRTKAFRGKAPPRRVHIHFMYRSAPLSHTRDKDCFAALPGSRYPAPCLRGVSRHWYAECGTSPAGHILPDGHSVVNAVR